MNAGSEFKIDLMEEFPHLDRAPIVEAVIHWRARGRKELQRDGLSDELKSKSGYPTVKTQKEVQLEAEIGPQGASQAQRAHWHGLRLESADSRNIAQFTRNGFVFSRLAPYEDWNRFAEEATRLWQVHVEIAEPVGIERLGVRFINRISPIQLSEVDETLALAPRCPGSLALPIQEFLHRSRFNVPKTPYNISIIQTTQPAGATEIGEIGLILDIDVFTTSTIEMNNQDIDSRLADMRWLKNKAFFNLMTPQAIDQFKGPES